MPGDLATTDHEPPVVAGPELAAGTRLADRYRLVRRLGAGGGGTVWQVHDDKVGEALALKLVDAGAELERWRREVALARRISHPGVCRVHDLGEAGGRRWVTMALIEGQSLRVRLDDGLDARARPILMAQLVDAVAAIHAAGVVHRDLKPENVVVDGDGRAVIVDFGLARTPTSAEPAGRASPPSPDARVTRDGAVVGTPRYMAPEQAEGGVADARSDVYSLGLVLREIAAPSDVAGRWGPVIARATAAAPSDRFADAAALRAALADPPRRDQAVQRLPGDARGRSPPADRQQLPLVLARPGVARRRMITRRRRRR